MNYDVIVVGARCAGSPIAMLLTRKGYKVLVVDKATFPEGSDWSVVRRDWGISTYGRHHRAP